MPGQGRETARHVVEVVPGSLPRRKDYAYRVSCQVTALALYGGMTFPSAIGAVVVGEPTTFQIPLSGQRRPVRAVVPMGFSISSPIAHG